MATNGNPPPGAATDARGVPVRDPSTNVMDVVDAAVERLDDLRVAALERADAAVIHVENMAAMRASFDEKLREAETKRIDAIRAVDVGAVNRAAEVSAAQALTLATQVATSAETLRAQVATTAEANRVALSTALNPVLESIADLRRIQYEQQGKSTAGTDPVLQAIAELQAAQNRDRGVEHGEDRTGALAMAASAAKMARLGVIVAASSAGGFFLYLAVAVITHGKF